MQPVSFHQLSVRTEIALYELSRTYRSVILLYRFDLMHGMRRATKISCECWSFWTVTGLSGAAPKR